MRAFASIVSMALILLITVGHYHALTAKEAKRPNVILVMTDDQGYGDLGCHGNRIIQTPNLDRLHKQSLRLTNFHVDPTCSPTRSALMSGRYSTRTGVWHTIMGRSLMSTEETTLAEVFGNSGYSTGIFGKWHLGDNYPLRPQDQGFQKVVVHGGGGVGQTPDYWGNDYFDDTYFHNAKETKHKGYCTDVFFDEALSFIKSHKEKPFFCYLPTNAPHGPYLVDEKYSKMYKGIPAIQAKFYGMITNIDENMGRLMAKLKEWNLEENTILIFMTDNGTAAGAGPRAGRSGFNAGMRGTKGSEYEGGHRVPCFFRWPTRWKEARDIDTLTAHVDMLPTLRDLCGLKPTKTKKLDGQSLVPLLDKKGDFPERTLFVHSQRVENPQKWRKCAVMTQQWRLVNGKELFDILKDPGQKKDVASDHPKVVTQLRKGYEEWYASLSSGFDDYVRIVVGNEAENPAWITCHDWHGNKVPWNHGMIKRHPKANGYWEIDVAQAGKYKVTLHRQPPTAPKSLDADHARISIGKVSADKSVAAGATSVTFEVELPKGPARMQTWLQQKKKPVRGAYFVAMELLK